MVVAGFEPGIYGLRNSRLTTELPKPTSLMYVTKYRKFLSNRIGASKRDIWTRAGNVIAPSLKY